MPTNESYPIWGLKATALFFLFLKSRIYLPPILMLLLSLPPCIKISTLFPHCHFKIAVLTRKESSWSLENIAFPSSYLEYTSWLLFPKLSPFAFFPYNAKVVQFLLFKRSIEWILIKKIHYKLFQWFWHCVLSKLKVEKT